MVPAYGESNDSVKYNEYLRDQNCNSLQMIYGDIAFQLEEFRKRKTGMKREQVIVLFLIQKN